jgi:hypothetical protein
MIPADGVARPIVRWASYGQPLNIQTGMYVNSLKANHYGAAGLLVADVFSS